MRKQVQLIKAFAANPEVGNPAGVIVDADDMSSEQMLRVAQHYEFSECAFVQSSDVADFRIRFFSVQQEVEFCGHATIATFFSLRKTGKIIFEDSLPKTVKQETGIGVLPVICCPEGKIMMTQNSVVFGNLLEDRDEISTLLGIRVADLMEHPMQIVSTGVKKLIVPIKDLSKMRKIKPDFKAIVDHGSKHNYSGIAVFTTESFTKNGDLATRNFNPSVGIGEDPATGIAAGPLAYYANRYLFDGSKKEIIIEQGYDMGKASMIYADITDAIKVGGYAAGFGLEDFEL